MNNTRLNTNKLTAQCRVATPLGPLTLAARAQGLAGIWFDDQKHHPGSLDAPQVPGNPFLAQAADELRRYFAGTLCEFKVPLDPLGTPFQLQVWTALRRIPFGGLDTYGDLAAQIGRPAASRAVGAAVGRNPLSIVVPCHRVLGKSGALTGYAGGLQRKTALLELEAANVSGAQALAA